VVLGCVILVFPVCRPCWGSIHQEGCSASKFRSRPPPLPQNYSLMALSSWLQYCKVLPRPIAFLPYMRFLVSIYVKVNPHRKAHLLLTTRYHDLSLIGYQKSTFDVPPSLEKAVIGAYLWGDGSWEGGCVGWQGGVPLECLQPGGQGRGGVLRLQNLAGGRRRTWGKGSCEICLRDGPACH